MTRALGETKAVNDLVKRPDHYQLLPEYEVKEVIKALLDKIDASDFDMSSYQVGWLQQSLQYQMRFYAKNGWEDLEKAYETLGFVLGKDKYDQYEQGMNFAGYCVLRGHNGNPMRIMADGQDCYLIPTSKVKIPYREFKVEQ